MSSNSEIFKIIHKRISNQFFLLLEKAIPINDFRNRIKREDLFRYSDIQIKRTILYHWNKWSNINHYSLLLQSSRCQPNHQKQSVTFFRHEPSGKSIVRFIIAFPKATANPHHRHHHHGYRPIRGRKKKIKELNPFLSSVNCNFESSVLKTYSVFDTCKWTVIIQYAWWIRTTQRKEKDMLNVKFRKYLVVIAKSLSSSS